MEQEQTEGTEFPMSVSVFVVISCSNFVRSFLERTNGGSHGWLGNPTDERRDSRFGGASQLIRAQCKENTNDETSKSSYMFTCSCILPKQFGPVKRSMAQSPQNYPVDPNCLLALGGTPIATSRGRFARHTYDRRMAERWGQNNTGKTGRRKIVLPPSFCQHLFRFMPERACH
jgi:hypothetical protein